MKKKSLLLFLSIVAAICCAVGLTACSHTHNFDRRVATNEYLKFAPNCLEEAVYYLSCECGERGDETFEYGEPIPHTFNKQIPKEKYLKSAATCTEEAVYYLSCGWCGEAGTDTFEYGGLASHTTIADKAVAATCTEAGLTEGCHCSVCREVLLEQETVAALGHTLEHHAAVAVACTEAGRSEYWECSVCGKCFSDEDCENQIEDITSVDIAKLGHNFEYGECKNCGISEPTRGVEYKAFSTHATVSGIGTATDMELVIADEYEGVPVTFIESNAFENCTWLVSVTIPTTVMGIGDYAFKGCTSLTEINYNAIECSDLRIGEGLFDNAGANGGGITVNIGASVKSIPAWLFGASGVHCPNIVSVVFAEDGQCESVGEHAFYACTSLKSVSFPDSVKYIWDYAFWGCSGLTSVTLGNGLIYINHGVFKDCTSLKSIIIPDSVTSIGISAFHNCSKLTSVILGNGVTNIGSYSFDNCTSLKSVTIPDCVTSIGDYAFNRCTSLASVTIGNGVTRIGDYAFRGCTSLTNISVDKDNSYYKSIDGNLYSYDGTELIQYAIGKTDTVFEIPDGVTTVGEDAFSFCVSLTGITIPNGVTRIENEAFKGCTSLTEAAFENTSGWVVGGWDGFNPDTDIAVDNLADTSVAATYLTEKYCYRPWKRS